MEASKCPKCGDEPFFIEHVEKWYCYGCNSYIDEEVDTHECSSDPAMAPEPEQVAEPEVAPVVTEPKPAEPEIVLEPVVEEPPKAEAKEEPREEPPARSALIAEELEAFEKEAVTNDAQDLLDSASPINNEMPGPVLDAKHEEFDVPVIAINDERSVMPEPKPDLVVEVKVKSCSSCGQPLKYIEKYQRHYCYGCRKYAPKEVLVKGTPEHGCPQCGGELKFIDKYHEWYCYSCKAYPLRVKKTEQPKPEVMSCLKCGEPLKLIEKYQRHYCYKCKEYAPKPAVVAPEAPKEKDEKSCPACKGEMKFIKEYNEWYCFKCKKYSLRPNKPILLL